MLGPVTVNVTYEEVLSGPDAIAVGQAKTLALPIMRAEGEAVRPHLAQIFESWPDLRFRGRSMYVGRDFVVQEWTATATHPSGRVVEWDGLDRHGHAVRPGIYFARVDAGSRSAVRRLVRL